MADKNRDNARDEEEAIPLRDAVYGQDDDDSSPGGRPHATSQAATPKAIVSSLTNNAPLSILAYCLASISMTVVNKFVVSGSSWNLTFLYLAAQNTICIIAITICKRVGLIENLAPVTFEKSKRWFPVSLLLVGMIYTSTKALQFLSVPVYTIFKNLTIIAIAYGEVFLFGGSVTRMALLSFSLMVMSSVVAAWADIRSATGAGSEGDDKSSEAFSTLIAGYTWMALNVFCTATFTLSLRKVIQKMDFKDWDTMYYNNLLSIPILCTFSLLTEDLSSENLDRNFPEDQKNRILMGIVYSGLAAIFISYCSAWCIRVTSSTTYSMVGALNKLPIAVSGLIFFSAPVTFGSVSAIIIGFISGIVYAFAKKREKEEKQQNLPVKEDTGDAPRPER